MADELEVAAAPVVETPAAEAVETGEEQTPEQIEQKRIGGVQKRIDRLTREREDQRREAEFWRAKAMETSKPKEDTKAATATEGKPSPDDYLDQTEYFEALSDWKIRDHDSKREATNRTKEAEKHRETVKQDFGKRLTTFVADHDDFQDVIENISHLPANPALVDEIDNHEFGPELLYYLGNNPEEAEKLANMTPTQVARAVGRMESKFVPSGEEREATKPVAQVSKAPKPPTPVGRSSKTEAKSMDDPDISMDEYRALRQKENPRLNWQ